MFSLNVAKVERGRKEGKEARTARPDAQARMHALDDVRIGRAVLLGRGVRRSAADTD